LQENGVQIVKKADIAKDRAATRSLLPLVAIGGGLAAAPASALELGPAAASQHRLCPGAE